MIPHELREILSRHITDEQSLTDVINQVHKIIVRESLVSAANIIDEAIEIATERVKR